MQKENFIEESDSAMDRLKACNPEYCFLGTTPVRRPGTALWHV